MLARRVLTGLRNCNGCNYVDKSRLRNVNLSLRRHVQKNAEFDQELGSPPRNMWKVPFKMRHVVGVVLAVSAAQYANIYYEMFHTEKCGAAVKLDMYRLLPLRMVSRAWGAINNIDLPESWRAPVYRWYIKRFNVDLEESAIRDLQHYKNLGEFFRRKLKPDCRSVDEQHSLVCPADGKVLSVGKVDKGVMEQVKGVRYRINRFIGPRTWPVPKNRHRYGTDADLREYYDMHNKKYHKDLLYDDSRDLYQCIIYLGPGDCHTFHSPTDWEVILRRHFPGELLSVNPGVARWFKGLFTYNERAVYCGQWEQGFFAMGPVGATNVGSIKVYFDQALETNKAGSYREGQYLDKLFTYRREGIKGHPLKKGDLFGEFNLGSSIVLLFEAPSTFEFKVRPGDKIKFGEPIGCYKNVQQTERVVEQGDSRKPERLKGNIQEIA